MQGTITVGDLEIEVSAHAVERAEERGLQGSIADDLARAHHLGVACEGLDAVRGRSGLVYLVRLAGPINRPAVKGTVVSVLTWLMAEPDVNGVWAGKDRGKWVPVDPRVWPPCKALQRRREK